MRGSLSRPCQACALITLQQLLCKHGPRPNTMESIFQEDLSIPDSPLLEGLDLHLDCGMDAQPLDWLGSLDDVGTLLDEQPSAQLATWEFLQTEPPAGSSTRSPSPAGEVEPPAGQAAPSSQEEQLALAQATTAWYCSSPQQEQQAAPCGPAGTFCSSIQAQEIRYQELKAAASVAGETYSAAAASCVKCTLCQVTACASPPRAELLNLLGMLHWVDALMSG